MVLEKHPSARLIAATVVPMCWMLCSSGLILLNKHLMMEKGFKYPVTLSGLGQGFSALAAFTTCRLLKWVPAEKRVDTRFFMFRMLPVGFFNATTLMFGNAVYMYLTVAFIQMLKAFTPVITMAGLFLASLETPTSQLIGSVFVIAGGTAVAGYGEINISITGMLIQLISESSEALRLIMTQTLLQGLSFHPVEGMMYLAPACLLWMVVGAAIVEFPTILREGALSIITENAFLFFAAASMGFAVTTLAFFTIQLCGSLTLKVLGTVKNAALVLFCVIFLREPVSVLQAFGYTVALAGFSWYQYIKISAKPLTPKPTGKDEPFDVHPKRASSGSQAPMSESATAVASGVVASGDVLSIRSELSLEESDTERDVLITHQQSKGAGRQSALESLLLVDRTHATPQHSRR